MKKTGVFIRCLISGLLLAWISHDGTEAGKTLDSQSSPSRKSRTSPDSPSLRNGLKHRVEIHENELEILYHDSSDSIVEAEADVRQCIEPEPAGHRASDHCRIEYLHKFRSLLPKSYRTSKQLGMIKALLLDRNRAETPLDQRFGEANVKLTVVQLLNKLDDKFQRKIGTHWSRYIVDFVDRADVWLAKTCTKVPEILHDAAYQLALFNELGYKTYSYGLKPNEIELLHDALICKSLVTSSAVGICNEFVAWFYDIKKLTNELLSPYAKPLSSEEAFLLIDGFRNLHDPLGDLANEDHSPEALELIELKIPVQGEADCSGEERARVETMIRHRSKLPALERYFGKYYTSYLRICCFDEPIDKELAKFYRRSSTHNPFACMRRPKVRE